MAILTLINFWGQICADSFWRGVPAPAQTPHLRGGGSRPPTHPPHFFSASGLPNNWLLDKHSIKEPKNSEVGYRQKGEAGCLDGGPDRSPLYVKRGSAPPQSTIHANFLAPKDSYEKTSPRTHPNEKPHLKTSWHFFLQLWRLWRTITGTLGSNSNTK